jgi:hypothetical protein
MKAGFLTYSFELPAREDLIKSHVFDLARASGLSLRKLICGLQYMIRKWLHIFFEISVGIGAAKTLTKPGGQRPSKVCETSCPFRRLLRMTMRRSRRWPCSPAFHQRTVCSFVGTAPLIGSKTGTLPESASKQGYTSRVLILKIRYSSSMRLKHSRTGWQHSDVLLMLARFAVLKRFVLTKEFLWKSCVTSLGKCTCSWSTDRIVRMGMGG